MYKVSISSHTDIGDRKQTNQDCVFHKNEVVNGHNVGLYIVADGCGGLEYGGEISEMIISHFEGVFGFELKKLIMENDVDEDMLDAFLDKSLYDINNKAVEFSKSVSVRVGSTVSLLLTFDNLYFIKNIGDSRVYLMRGSELTQLTVDHSLLELKIQRGEITREEAKTFRKKNVITMCVGAFDKLKIYSKKGNIKKGDVFLLCSDGLHNLVPTKQMYRVINDTKIPFEEKAKALRNCIATGTAFDNVSSVLCMCGRKSVGKWVVMLLAVALLLLMFKFDLPGRLL